MSFDLNYFEGTTSPYEGGYKSAIKHLERFYCLVDKYSRSKLGNISRILDVGCAYGYFLKFWEGKGVELYGTDISQYAISQAQEIVDAELLVGDIQHKMPFDDDFFDIITMFDVIQMTESPRRALQEVLRLLKPDGLFFVTAPNVNSLFRLLRGDKWRGFRDRNHLYLFTPTSFTFLLRRSGFKILQVKTPQFWPFPKKLVRLSYNLPFGNGIWVAGTK
jgi:SAM-dependent methyltransferase